MKYYTILFYINIIAFFAFQLLVLYHGNLIKSYVNFVQFHHILLFFIKYYYCEEKIEKKI